MMLKTKGVSIIRNAATAVLLACLQSACSSDGDTVSTIDVGSEESLTMSWEEFRQQAVRETLAGKTIYAVDGDVFTDSEEDLRAYYDAMLDADYEPKLAIFKQISTGFEPAFPAATALNIKYCVSNRFASFAPFSKATMVTAMQTATTAWQNVANVRFAYLSAHDSSCTEANGSIDFAVVPSTFPDYSGCGTNKLLWGNLGCPISGPYTATAAKGVLAVNLPQLPAFVSTVGLLKHELGHILGFRHEHPWGPGGCGNPETPTIGDTTGRRLTNYDVPSVMHYQGKCGKANIDYTISALDGVGSRQVYGMPAAWHIPLFQVH